MDQRIPRPSFLDGLPLGRDAASIRRRVEALEHVLEGLVTIPGIKRKVGLDVMLDLVPVLGPTAGAVMGSYLVWEARNLGMSRWHMARMMGNVGTDWLLGLIPFVGALPDLLFRSNSRNLRLVRRHLDRHHPAGATLEG
ncbi:MAG TPA: DUF4112 domain-containing protein [Sphingomonas sp.]|jgi:hypothetical protein|nr:DUF4112 domain-containing protein [Sphingomonas sp.]